jgi:hypothetical protein
MDAARRRQVDVVVCWRFGRNLRHLTTIEELNVAGVAFVGESIDTSSPTGAVAPGHDRHRRAVKCSYVNRC